MTIQTYIPAGAMPATPLRRPPYLMVGLVEMLCLGRQRRQLARITDQLLDDIGLTRDEAMAEGRRPFWDVPSFWQR